MMKKNREEFLPQVADIERSLEAAAQLVESRKAQEEKINPRDQWEKSQHSLAERRLAYVSAVNSSDMNLNELRVAISEVARRRGEFPAPAVASVLRWRRYINADGTLPLRLLAGQQGGPSKKSLRNRFYEE